MYQYFIYGLGIHSEIKLYNLEETPSMPDVLVHYGSIPEDIIEKTKRGHVSSMSQTRVWFQNDAGHFIILNGNEIMVQPLNNADEKTPRRRSECVQGFCVYVLRRTGRSTA